MRKVLNCFRGWENKHKRMPASPHALNSMIICILLQFILFSAQIKANAQTSLLSTNSPFVKYLQNPPWIKDIVFKRNQLYETSKSLGLVDSSEEIIEEYKGGLQSEGFYLQRVYAYSEMADGEPGSRTTKSLLGTSGDYFWTAYWEGEGIFDERGLVLDPRDRKKGGSDNNATRGLLSIYQQYLESIRFLGLKQLRPGTFTITAKNQFEATETDGTRLSGQILKAMSNAPLSLTYTTGDGKKFLINYGYGTNLSLPNYFEIVEKDSNQVEKTPQTNWVSIVSYGVDNRIKNGYSPLLFFKTLSSFNHIVIWSNGVDYTLGIKGQFSADGQFQPPSAFPSLNLRRATESRLLMAFIIFGSLVVAWAIMRRAKMRKINNNKQT